MRRRDFVKFIGGGAAAFGLVGKDALKAVEKIEKKPALDPLTPEKLSEEQQKYPILRICQPVSTWAQNGRAVPGEWFMHNYGSKTCQKLAKDLVVTAIKPAGWRAVRFKEYKHGVGPVETHTNPNSPEFRKIQALASNKDGRCVWGPVFHITFVGEYRHLWREETVELFCNSLTMRRFADRQIISNINFVEREFYNILASRVRPMLLSTVSHTSGSFHWYGAKLQTFCKHYES